jgi:hypothetical protein
MRKMRRPIVITAPWATPEDTARTYGIGKRRAAELKRMVEESLARKGFITLEGKESLTARNGANNGTTRSRGLNKKVQGNSKVKSKSGSASRRKAARAKARTSR